MTLQIVPCAAPPPGQPAGLARAFAAFTEATARLEREYGQLAAHVAQLRAELEDKNRLLDESAARERRLEAEALRQSRLAAMGEMAAMLAHEVRNPLGAMELFTGLLLQDLQAQPEPLRLARMVAASIADLNHLVTNLLEFTRTRLAERTPLDVAAVVDDVLGWTTELRAAGGVTVTRAIAPAATWAEGDAGLLRPVVMNLVRNAVQAMPDGGTITVRLAEEGDGRVRLDVADTGAGIPPGQEEAIFRPFVTTKTKGTGLGLAVARELVEAMGGSIAAGRAPGGGACFSVWLRSPGASDVLTDPNDVEEGRPRLAVGA